MLDDNPVLKERLMGLGAFAGIAVFAVAALDVMVTGGFDFAPARAAQAHEQPSAYVRMADAAQYVSDRVRTVSWDAPLIAGDAYAATSEDLDGANDGSPVSGEPTGDELYSEIASLYERSERQNAEDEPAHEEPSYEDEFSPEESEKLAIASGNG